jgi:hypothetical protein
VFTPYTVPSFVLPSQYDAVFIFKGYLLCGQRLSPGTAYPCRFCWIPKSEASNPYTLAAERTADDNRRRTAACRQRLQTLPPGGRGIPGEVTAALTALSCNPVENGTWDAPFGVENRGTLLACALFSCCCTCGC